jgi:hypothetical protein
MPAQSDFQAGSLNNEGDSDALIPNKSLLSAMGNRLGVYDEH